VPNDYSSIVDLYDLYVTDTGDHPFWSRCAAEADGPILELTAGTGRATTALRAGSAQPLVALDINPGMLRRLLGRFRDRPGVVRAVAGDMVALPFAAGHFALVVIALNAFGEVVEAAARATVLAEVRRVLRSGGRAVITLHDPAHRRPTLDGTARRLGPFATPDGQMEVAVRGRLLRDEVAESEQTYRLLDALGKVVEERQVRLRFAIPDAPSLLCAAAGAGLDLVALYGDYDRAPYIAGSSPFIVAVLSRTRAAARLRP
jgi:SAM-dependent methyltransferase